MILRRYQGFSYFDSLSWSEGLEILNFALEKEQDEKIYNRWIHENMHLEKQLSFEDYKSKLLGKSYKPNRVKNNRSFEDIEARVKNIRLRKIDSLERSG